MLKKNKKGSSLIMVLVVTLLIITLGSVALSMSLSNVRMSAKVKDYNKEYYDLEKAAEEVLEKIDIELKTCEDNALNYLKEENFKKEYKSETDPHIQNFKYPGGNQIFFNEKWKKDVFNKSLYSANSNVVNPVVYEKNFQNYFDQAFNRIYFSYAQKVIEEFVRTFNVKYQNENISCKVALKLDNNKNYNKAYNYTNWDDFDLNSGDLNLQLTFENKIGRKINAEVSVIPPHYTAISKEEKKAYRANPIWANALVSNGDITFKRGNFTLHGDLVSMNENGSNIIFTDNVRLSSYGNMLASKEIIFRGEKNEVNVKKADGSYELKFKESLFGNVYLFQDDEVVVFPRNITQSRPSHLYEGSTHKYGMGIMPMFFNDIIGGNVYCNNLSMKSTSKNSTMSSRNLMVGQSIDISSIENSELAIEKLFIGTGVTSGGITYLPEKSTLLNGNKLNLPQDYMTNDKSKITNYQNKGGTEGKFRELTSLQNDKRSVIIDNPLYNVLKYKTTRLGTPYKSFSNMIYEDVLKGIKDPNIIKMTYYEGNKDLVLNNETKDTIIYCGGDLNIRGNGTINGVVIAKGNINLEGDIKIKYDETVIKNALRESLYVEKFFSVCEIGKGITVGVDENNKPITSRKDVSSNVRARKRVSKDRYNILKWNRK